MRLHIFHMTNLAQWATAAGLSIAAILLSLPHG